MKASSVFEAAVKMGFLLKEMNVLKPKDPTSIVVTNEREDRFKYNAIEDGELVAVQSLLIIILYSLEFKTIVKNDLTK